MAHREDLLIIHGDEFPIDLILFFDVDLFPRRKTTFFHYEKLQIIYADDIIDDIKAMTIYMDNSLGLNRKTTFFHLSDLVIINRDVISQTDRNF